MAENTPHQDISSILPVWIYKFPTPKTFKFSFEGTFRNVEAETAGTTTKLF
jgi:hypothetical protein